MYAFVMHFHFLFSHSTVVTVSQKVPFEMAQQHVIFSERHNNNKFNLYINIFIATLSNIEKSIFHWKYSELYQNRLRRMSWAESVHSFPHFFFFKYNFLTLQKGDVRREISSTYIYYLFYFISLFFRSRDNMEIEFISHFTFQPMEYHI